MSDISTTFAALGDRTRLQLVERLLSEGELPAGALAAQCAISAPAVSRHLKVLRESGLLRQRAEGQKRLYSVHPEALRRLDGWLASRRAFWEASLDRLEQVALLDPAYFQPPKERSDG